MYIEFNLAKIHLPTLEYELQNWLTKHQLQYNIKILNQKVKITFPLKENYSYFCLTWNPELEIGETFVLVEPMKVDKSQ